MDDGAKLVPDDATFQSFRKMCESDDGWNCSYNKHGMEVWMKPPDGSQIHNVKGRMILPDVSADTVFDVLHDVEYRKSWDMNVIETFHIGQVSANSDVGYHSWRCPKPLMNRDIVTLRSWLSLEDSFLVVSYSVKHRMYPPRHDMVRAISIQAGYLVIRTGRNSCKFTYTAQMDPRGSIPKWLVKKTSEYMAPKVMWNLHKACLWYHQWKEQNMPNYKPWLNPEQNLLSRISLSELSLQTTASLEKMGHSSRNENSEESKKST
ncbi:START domain-containing protein 10-like [Discoglossus pictus]